MPGRRIGGILLWARALVLAAVALLGGTVAHTAADGLLPSTRAMLVLLAAAALVASRFVRRPPSRTLTVLLVIGGQTAIHVALTLLAGHRGDVPASAPAVALAPATGSLHDELMGGRVPRAATPSGEWVTHLARHVSEQSPWMVLGHLVAAVLLGWWVATGETAVCRLLVLVGVRLRERLTGPTSPHPGPGRGTALRPPRDAAPAPVVRRRPWVVGALTHRGPPLLAG